MAVRSCGVPAGPSAGPARPGRGSLHARLCPARGSLHARLCPAQPAQSSLQARLCPARPARLCPARPCAGSLGLQGAPEARPAPGPARPAAEAEAEIGCQGALNMARRNAERWLCLGMERPASLPFSCAPARCSAKLLCERSRELPQAKQS